MAINFPTSPYLNQIYTYGGLSWIWNGTYWQNYSSTPFNAATGGTFNNGTITLTGTGVLGTITGITDTYVTGGTYTNGTATFTNNTGGTFNVVGFTTPFTGGTVTGATNFTGGLTANTFYGNGSNISGINLSQLATTAHTHPISEVINLQSNLDGKIDKPSNPFLGDYLYYNGITWVPNQVNIPVSAGAGISLFLSVTGSTLPTYEFLSEFPIQASEIQESVVVNNSTQLIGKYATKQLNRTKIDAGIWEFNTYASVDIPTTGSSRIIVNAYLLSTGGSETFLFSGETENIASTAATLYTTSVVQQQFSCNTTDYLIIDYSGSTNNNFNTTVSLYHGGTFNYSHIHTPFTTLHNELTGLQGGLTNEYYHLSQNEVSLLTTNVDASSIHNHNSLYLGLGGGTVTGSTVFNSTLSATTYLGLPVDIRVTGGTYSNGTAIFTNNTGGTFNVSGFSTSTQFTGGTVTGATNFTTSLSANTISATTYQNLPIDVFTTGGTYSNNTFTFTNNTGGTFTASFNTVTGLTINGNLVVTGTSSFTTLTATTQSPNDNSTKVATTAYVDAATTGATVSTNIKTTPITMVADGGGGVVTTGRKGGIWRCPFDGTITGWYLLEGTNTTSSCVIDTWQSASYPPTVANSIWVTKPSLTSATSNSATGLSINVTAGDYFAFNIDSCTSATFLTLVIILVKD